MPFEPHDIFPSLRPVGMPADGDDWADTARGANVIDLPMREGENEVEAGFDRWVQMCRQFAISRGG